MVPGRSNGTRRAARTVVCFVVTALVAAGSAVLAGVSFGSVPAFAAETPSTTPPFPAGTVGVVGCSNTSEHLQGYRAESRLDQMPQYQFGGLSFDMWGDPAAEDFAAAWRKYDGERPATGYRAAWVQMCITVGTPDPTALLGEVVDQIRTRDPAIPVYVSPINQYLEGHVCGRIGPEGFTVGQATVDWGVDNLSIERGPITGPLGADHLSTDSCHLGSAGIDLVGAQLVAWFDEGGWATGHPAGPLIIALQRWCAAIKPLVTVGVLSAPGFCRGVLTLTH